MAPYRSTALKAPASDGSHELSSRHQTITIQSPVRTPNESPKKIAIGITQAQKQALIDNLQLEITERARKLRAQYTLQAQSLRNRIDLRINRIPKSLRTANMGELFSKYQENKNKTSKTNPLNINPPSQEDVAEPIVEPISIEAPAERLNNIRTTASNRTRGTKRKSDEMENFDKENIPNPSQTIPNPKKRAQAIAGATAQKALNQSTILSPKSSNSRTLPKSPIHPSTRSPQRPFISCPASPLKPVVIIKSTLPTKSTAAMTANTASVVSEKVKPTRAKAATTRKASNLSVKPKPIVGRPKRVDIAPIQSRSVSNTSHASNASTGTTIMKKGAKSTTVTAPAASKRKNVAQAATKKASTVTEAPPPGRRVLRKRA